MLTRWVRRCGRVQILPRTDWQCTPCFNGGRVSTVGCWHSASFSSDGLHAHSVALHAATACIACRIASSFLCIVPRVWQAATDTTRVRVIDNGIVAKRRERRGRSQDVRENLETFVGERNEILVIEHRRCHCCRPCGNHVRDCTFFIPFAAFVAIVIVTNASISSGNS